MIPGRFKGRTAIVTGGASGIGAATVRRLAAEGANVLAVDSNSETGNAIAAENPAITFHLCDVSEPSQIEAVITQANARFGRLDILVNNAGIGGPLAATPEVEIEAWRRVMAVNIDSIFYACRAAIPLMRAGGGGAIVNTASISGLAGDYSFTAYNASKGAVINYTKALAIDHARDNIRVNAICPGLIETALSSKIKDYPALFDAWLNGIPLKRAGSAIEMANIICFLASDESSYMTGSIVVADGGVTAQTGQPDFVTFLKQNTPAAS